MFAMGTGLLWATKDLKDKEIVIVTLFRILRASSKYKQLFYAVTTILTQS